MRTPVGELRIRWGFEVFKRFTNGRERAKFRKILATTRTKLQTCVIRSGTCFLVDQTREQKYAILGEYTLAYIYARRLLILFEVPKCEWLENSSRSFVGVSCNFNRDTGRLSIDVELFRFFREIRYHGTNLYSIFSFIFFNEQVNTFSFGKRLSARRTNSLSHAIRATGS